MKKLIAVIMVLLMFPTVSGARDLSTWAENDYVDLSAYGVLSNEIVERDLGKNITRGEFCKLITNIYETKSKVTIRSHEKNAFSDTTDESILKAYKLGIVSGRDDGAFYPDDFVTRQEMAVMISRTLKLISTSYVLYENQVRDFNQKFSDSTDTDKWALSDMAAVCSVGIINGNENKMVEPKKNATREQAICMLNRLYDGHVQNKTIYQIPKIKKFTASGDETYKISLEWSYTPNVNAYSVIIKQEGKDAQIINLSSNCTELSSYNTQMSSDKEIDVYVGASLKSGVWVFSLPKNSATSDKPTTSATDSDLDDTTDTKDGIENDTDTDTADDNSTDNLFNTIDYDRKFAFLTTKEQRVFPNGYYFTTKEEAEQYMTEVTVPVWKLNSDGTKVSSQKYITVNQALADDVVSIFTEIYNDESKFPIKDVGGYNWRNTAGGSVSQHSFGTCIDINWNENYYVRPDGTPITGSYWKPGEDPYSIPEDSMVVKTFAKYGWEWGGNAWSDSYAKDYMHFTYLGK